MTVQFVISTLLAVISTLLAVISTERSEWRNLKDEK